MNVDIRSNVEQEHNRQMWRRLKSEAVRELNRIHRNFKDHSYRKARRKLEAHYNKFTKEY